MFTTLFIMFYIPRAISIAILSPCCMLFTSPIHTLLFMIHKATLPLSFATSYL